MDKSRIYQKNKEYELGNGILKLNLYNGRMLYKYFVTSIGNGNFYIDVSLSYNFRSMGKKWKYSFEEWVKKYENSYNIEGCNVEDYIYTDKEWNIHRFVKYKENTYYDESGTGLRLKVNEDNLQIEDEYKNVCIYDK